MTLDNPQNILFKLNNIQDNIEYLNREPIAFINSSLSKNILINESNDDYLKTNSNNYSI